MSTKYIIIRDFLLSLILLYNLCYNLENMKGVNKMIINKISALLSIKQTNLNNFIKDNKLSQPNFSQKAKRNSFYAKELIMIADYTNTKLAFIDEDNKPVIVFESEDIEKKD